MTPRVTHHDDCGCLSDRYERRIAALRHALRGIIANLHKGAHGEIVKGAHMIAISALDADEKEGTK